MGVFSKLKDVLFDVEEEEIPTITKEEEDDDIREVIREENPIKEVKMPKEDVIQNLEPIMEEKEEIAPLRKEFNFPLEDDFEEEIPRRVKNDFFDEEFATRTTVRETHREEAKLNDNYGYDYSRLDIKEVKKETKGFTPSPVISPVYGILDQNYTKDDVIVKNSAALRGEKPNLDDVRKKAYGSKKKEKEEVKDFKGLDEILNDKNIPDSTPEEVKEEVEEEMPILDKSVPIGVYDDELPDEPYADEKVETIEEESSHSTTKDLESDLFNLIDSMYEEKNEREEEE